MICRQKNMFPNFYLEIHLIRKEKKHWDFDLRMKKFFYDLIVRIKRTNLIFLYYFFFINKTNKKSISNWKIIKFEKLKIKN